MKKNILVFPCGSEIGLEIHRSLKYSTYFNLIGGSSVDDHGKFVYENYVENIPFHNAVNFLETIKKIVLDHNIDAIYPTMDEVARTLKNNEEAIGCRVVGSSAETTAICASKKLTYKKLKDLIPIPKTYATLDSVEEYPLFIKPDVGYSSKNVYLAKDETAAQAFLKGFSSENDFVFCEFLPGAEFTIDCFSDRYGNLLFSGARKRVRISNGISVNTKQANEHNALFSSYADVINKQLKPRGAWFFQMKFDKDDILKLLEVASRLGGSSSLFRSKGVNFAMLSAFDCFDMDVEIMQNRYEAELDRALLNRYKLKIEYTTVYVDYDDCILLGDKVNQEIIAYLYAILNQRKKIILITRHTGNLQQSLSSYRLQGLFDEVIHLTKKEKKSDYINPTEAIFIDDSHTERADVKKKHNIHVFSPDMVETLF